MILDLFLCVPKEEPLKHAILNICLLAVYIYRPFIFSAFPNYSRHFDTRPMSSSSVPCGRVPLDVLTPSCCACGVAPGTSSICAGTVRRSPEAPTSPPNISCSACHFVQLIGRKSVCCFRKATYNVSSPTYPTFLAASCNSLGVLGSGNPCTCNPILSRIICSNCACPHVAVSRTCANGSVRALQCSTCSFSVEDASLASPLLVLAASTLSVASRSHLATSSADNNP